MCRVIWKGGFDVRCPWHSRFTSLLAKENQPTILHQQNRLQDQRSTDDSPSEKVCWPVCCSFGVALARTDLLHQLDPTGSPSWSRTSTNRWLSVSAFVLFCFALLCPCPQHCAYTSMRMFVKPLLYHAARIGLQ